MGLLDSILGAVTGKTEGSSGAAQLIGVLGGLLAQSGGSAMSGTAMSGTAAGGLPCSRAAKRPCNVLTTFCSRSTSLRNVPAVHLPAPAQTQASN